MDRNIFRCFPPLGTFGGATPTGKYRSALFNNFHSVRNKNVAFTGVDLGFRLRRHVTQETVVWVSQYYYRATAEFSSKKKDNK
jgi:hypothetical protein